MNLSDAEYDALLRCDFASFVERCFMELTPGTDYLWNWHIDLIAAELTQVAMGEKRRFIVNLPPRSLKSVIASVALPAWILGREPTREVICVSYVQELADKMASDCRQIMCSAWFERLFGYRLDARAAVSDLQTPYGGGRLATSVGGALTGRGADLIVVDDPIKPADALSDANRKAANQWLSHTMMSRLNDKRRGAIVVIMQRLHMDDPTGHLVAQGGWDHLVLPAISSAWERHSIRTALRMYEVQRAVGEALHPEREPLEVLDRLRLDLGSYDFAGQYLQCPVPLGGGIVKREWFRSYAPSELPERFDQVVQSWDTANKASERADFSVCTTWGIKGDLRYLLDVMRQRLEYPELKRAVMMQAQKFDANRILIEDHGSGTQLIQELKFVGTGRVEGVLPKGEKFARMLAQTAAIEAGQVLVPSSATWLETYMAELTVFPVGAHDDQVDSTSQALAWIVSSLYGKGMGLFNLMRCRYEESLQREGGQKPPIDL